MLGTKFGRKIQSLRRTLEGQHIGFILTSLKSRSATNEPGVCQTYKVSIKDTKTIHDYV